MLQLAPTKYGAYSQNYLPILKNIYFLNGERDWSMDKAEKEGCRVWINPRRGVVEYGQSLKGGL